MSEIDLCITSLRDIRDWNNDAYTRLVLQWIDDVFLSENTACTVVNYNQGDCLFKEGEGIPPHEYKHLNFKHPLGIVLHGRVEVNNLRFLGEFPLYRPIRIIGPGQIIGEFSVLDNCHDFPGCSRPGEKWTANAGYISTFIQSGEPDSKILDHIREAIETTGHHDYEKPSRLKPHLLFNNLKSPEETKIAFIEAGSLIRKSTFYNQLLDYSWPKARIYRNALNSYNYESLLDFKNKALNVISDIDTSKIGATAYIGAFVEAIWDACNRPAREEPMFVSCDLAVTGCKDESSTIFIASDIYLTENVAFYFPIDFLNYRFSEVIFEGVHKTLDVFDQKKPRSKAVRDKLKIIAERVLKLLDTSPYHISVMELTSFKNYHLFLKFEK